MLLARRQFRGQTLVETVIDLPIVLPPSVAGLALLLVFGRRGLLGSTFEVLGITIAFTYRRGGPGPGLRGDAVLRALGADRVRPAWTTISRTPLGSTAPSERQLFTSITVPLASYRARGRARHVVGAGAPRVGATIMFAGNVEGITQTLPLVVYGEFQAGNLDTSIAAATILVFAAFGSWSRCGS